MPIINLSIIKIDFKVHLRILIIFFIKVNLIENILETSH